MLTALAPVGALLLSVAVLQMGNGLQGTSLPVRASIEAFPTVAIGILGSSYFLGFTGGCTLGPRAVRRVGHIRAFTAMVSIASTTALVHALMPNPVVWWLLRALAGFVSLRSTSSWKAGSMSVQRMGRGVWYFRFTTSLSSPLSPWVR